MDRLKFQQSCLKQREHNLQSQSKTLMQQGKSQILQQGNLQAAFMGITEAASKTLQVHRASIWLYNEEN
ncbi:MAG: hypothetical protein HRU34_10340 [Richelia sp.]|nr:hypothetical protein [Richelia sp.]